MSGVTQSVIRRLRGEFALKASKALGQNFLIDPNIAEKIASFAKHQPNVVEIGPGVGSLTIFLAMNSRVFAIEYDRHLLEPLEYVLRGNGIEHNVEIIHDDIMKTDLDSLCRSHGVKAVVGNLPYNISAPLIVDIARYVQYVDELIVMVQTEVAERIAARQGTRQVAGVTLKTQYFMDVEILFNVPPQSFYPEPRVDSTVMKLTRLKSPEVLDPATLFDVIDTAFSQRRKMLRQSLKALFTNDPTKVLNEVGIDASLRPEQCTLDDFRAISAAIKEDNE